MVGWTLINFVGLKEKQGRCNVIDLIEIVKTIEKSSIYLALQWSTAVYKLIKAKNSYNIVNWATAKKIKNLRLKSDERKNFW